MQFTKMHGIGNDYVYINGITTQIADPADLAVRMSREHFGVGSDGLILILPSDVADFKMRMFNKDGSEGAMCGNGARCVGLYVFEHGLTKKTSFTLETGGGIRPITLLLEGGRVASVCVDMGPPQSLRAAPEHTLVSMGNPHAVYFISHDPFIWPDFLRIAGRQCEELDANIEYAQILSRGAIKMRVFERGSGETLACGSGACASAVAAQIGGYTDRSVEVTLRGGALRVDWREEDGHVLLTGPAVTVFEGDWLLS